ncbi:NAD(P)/FAD-dependent oxidoreductase [Agriterribacter sp.]|uniref:NAD(P)/FAD-dependent oxidoreductase n=1 Tax=Agriterribacter sp. TaxID=2821509 RepID=UPI002CFD17EA|nr:NAD(P)/FAD-dependent oxidoreductase [Agriterribacter sp.]HTN05923.1 NAD(P)/FAD-dependent oxidoreductase [Agriterribacter sp.]
MTTTHTYDAAIVGGGLAGLCLSIQLAKEGHRVILFEKEKYPFHKVCGEYISFECWNFLEEIGVPLSDWNLPHINNLLVSSPSGQTIKRRLPLGGFGISRYKLDAFLAELARNAGVEIKEETKVDNVWFSNAIFHVQYGTAMCRAKQVCGTFGKRSNLDVKLKRSFIQKKPGKFNNYIAVKYHIKTDFPRDHIALHNFKNGYCGISQVEDEKYCLCYLTTAQNLQQCDNVIAQLEQNILRRNPYLDKLFGAATFLYPSPLTIAQISFDKKTQLEHHMLMTGDAAGMIAPLCGNGMSMAMHGSKIAFQQIHPFLQGKISRYEMESAYQINWNTTFQKRLKTGRRIQGLFGREWLTNYFIRLMQPFPSVADRLIKQTHGEPF